MSEAARDGSWLRRLASEIGRREDVITLFADNTGAEALANGAAGSGRTKHIDVRAHFVRDAVAKGEIEISHIPSELNTADGLTKALGVDRFESCRAEMGIAKVDD